MVTPASERELAQLLEKAVTSLGLMLDEKQLQQLTTYFGLLLRWNDKINLTSVRRPEEIAVRHFGESLFLAKLLRPQSGLMVDVGSGAGFPGLPVKIASPSLQAVLLEPTIKKMAFLREVIRQCALEGVDARAERLEEAARGDLAGQAKLVTMRAVALKPGVLAGLKKLLAPGGRIALFLGEQDAVRIATAGSRASEPGEQMQWEPPAVIPYSERRVILMGTSKPEKAASNEGDMIAK